MVEVLRMQVGGFTTPWVGNVQKPPAPPLGMDMDYNISFPVLWVSYTVFTPLADSIELLTCKHVKSYSINSGCQAVSEFVSHIKHPISYFESNTISCE